MEKVTSIRVRLLKVIAGQPNNPGDEVDVDPIVGAEWIGAGYAVPAPLNPSDRPGFSFEPGDEIDVDDRVAEAWIAAGLAVAKYPC